MNYRDGQRFYSWYRNLLMAGLSLEEAATIIAGVKADYEGFYWGA